MATANTVEINKAIEKSLGILNVIRECEIILKMEQEIAVRDLLMGKDVLAVLPTGFGKSMIFTVFVLAKQEMANLHSDENASTCIIVISPLTSIICDQIAEMDSLGCTALELSGENIAEIVKSPPQFLYCSAEKALEKAFIDSLKDDNTALHQSVAAIVVDESHTVETWTGKRYFKIV